MASVCCSIVIVNWKSIDYLLKCKESIKINTTCRYEIIVVDNSSGSKEQERLRKIPDITLILNNENRGFAAANNQAFRVANGDFILMLNPDTIVLNSAIDKMMDFLLNNDMIHAVAPKLYYSENLDYHPSIKKFRTPFTHFLQMLPLAGLIRDTFSKLSFDSDKTQKVDCVWGAVILFKKEVFEKIGYLDERFFIYSEELDFCRRMAQKKMLVCYYPQAEVIHYGGKSQNRSSVAKNRYMWASIIKYFDKYFSQSTLLFSLMLLSVLLKIKVKVFKKSELVPVIEVLEERLSARGSHK